MIAGTLFGTLSSQMVGRNITEYIPLPHSKRSRNQIAAAYMEDDAKSGNKRGALKGASIMRKLGPIRTMQGRHNDGLPLPLNLQCVQMEGVENRCACRFPSPWLSSFIIFKT